MTYLCDSAVKPKINQLKRNGRKRILEYPCCKVDTQTIRHHSRLEREDWIKSSVHLNNTCYGLYCIEQNAILPAKEGTLAFDNKIDVT